LGLLDNILVGGRQVAVVLGRHGLELARLNVDYVTSVLGVCIERHFGGDFGTLTTFKTDCDCLIEFSFAKIGQKTQVTYNRLLVWNEVRS
jgi:hypothetical protein